MISTLLHHDYWANRRVVDMLSLTPGYPQKVNDIMDHIIAASATWYSRVRGEDAQLPVWGSEIGPEQWIERLEYFCDCWKAVLAEENLGRVITYHNTSGHAFSNTIEEIMTHLFMHGQYHRGQIISLTRDYVDKPVSTDLIVYLRETKVAF